MNDTIALIGLMGTGKSTIGRIVAGRLGRRFLDNDLLLTERFGASTAELRDRLGATELHRLEREILAEQLDSPGSNVINAAASALDDLELRERLHEHAYVVWLCADPAVLAARIAAGPPRPSLTVEGLPTASEIESVAEQRDQGFAAIADLTIDTTVELPAASADRIVSAVIAEDQVEQRPRDLGER
jgi:shikimate kinase